MTYDNLHRIMLEKALAYRPQAMNILEVGCGNGHYLQVLAAAFPGAHIAGIDVSEQSIEKAATLRTSRIGVQTAAAEKLPFPPASFDLVFAAKTLHHWDDKQKGIAEVARVLKPDGLLVLGDPLIDGPLRWKAIRMLGELTDGGVFTEHEELAGFFSHAGLEPCDLTPVPGTAKTLTVCIARKMHE